MLRYFAIAVATVAIVLAAASSASAATQGPGTTAAPVRPKMAVMDIDHPKCPGNLILELFWDAAPGLLTYWTNLIRNGWYDSATQATPRWLYRHHPNFVIQGGGLNITTEGAPCEYKIPNEKYTVAMARGEGPLSGGSEFFFNLANNSKLLSPASMGGETKSGYAVFAKLVFGFQVFDCLVSLPTHEDPNVGMTTFDQPWPIIKNIRLEH
jgi:cyclophilin family peptidyl-prolyl cis-trans isomerase